MTTQNDNSSATKVTLGRHIGLSGGIALVIGGVIGMGIYALIAAVGAQAGTGLWLGFVSIVIMQLPVVGLVYIILSLLVTVYYFVRVRRLRKSGVNWEQRVKKIPGE